MKALVLIAHGNRREASNEAVINLSEVVAQELINEYSIVRAGFLELAQPSIPEAIDNCVRVGATEVGVAPFFLSNGRHVYQDVPAEVNKARKVHTDLTIVITPHIGESPKLKDLIRAIALSAVLN